MSLTIVSVRSGEWISERHLILGERDMVITLSAWSLRQSVSDQSAEHIGITGIVNLTIGAAPQLPWAFRAGWFSANRGKMIGAERVGIMRPRFSKLRPAITFDLNRELGHAGCMAGRMTD